MSEELDTFVSCGFIKKEKIDDLSLPDTALEKQSDNNHLHSNAQEIALQS